MTARVKMLEFRKRFAEINGRVKIMRSTAPYGTDITFENSTGKPVIRPREKLISHFGFF